MNNCLTTQNINYQDFIKILLRRYLSREFELKYPMSNNNAKAC